ncbi:MAG: FtsX-like permease family protein [Gallionella sp.]|nr:FtsX-like permease family protein [Gallionella sp.]
MNLLRLSLTLLRRDWRAGEWRVLLLALVLAVGSLSTVGLFADRVRQALQQQAQSLIGADLRLTSTRPFSPDYLASAKAQGLQAIQSHTFPSMVIHGEQVVLSEILAVEAGYPLRGKIVIETSCAFESNQHLPPCRGKGGMGVEQQDGNASTPTLARPLQEGGNVITLGTVWADERLLRRLNIKLGDTVEIGASSFIVAARIVKDIDISMGFSSFAPRVLMNDADLAATGLMQEGSRVSFRQMYAGDAQQIVELRKVLEAQLTGNEKLEDVRDARPEIRTALERAEHFLGLAALTAAILAGAAMALAARRFVDRHLDACAVMRCMGAQQSQLLWLFLYQFIVLGLLAIVAGCVLGYVTQALLIASVAALHEASLPQPSIAPLLNAALSGYALLLGFAFLPLLQLRKVSPLRVLRRELGAPQASAWLVYGFAILVLSALFVWHSGSLKLGMSVLAGVLFGMLLFAAAAWALLLVSVRYTQGIAAHWRHAFTNLARQGRSSAVQIVALSLGGMALLVLTLVRADLMASWQGKLPPDTPNRFLVNVQVDQYQPVLDFFRSNNLPAPELQPMVRGRLVEIGNHVISPDDYPDPRARGLVEREFNLSYMEQMPSWNELVSGKWWNAGAAGELSVEEGIAKTLGIHLGDTLTYDVAGSRFTARVTSLRKVQWDSMKVNFFVITTPDVLKEQSASYLSSFYLPADRARLGDELARAFPNILLIDTGAVIAQVRDIMARIAQTVSAVFLFTLLCGLVVLYAALLATQDARRHEAAILRTLGADSHYLRRMHLAEFAVLGAMSGLFAAAGAESLGWVLAHFVFEIPYLPDPSIWLIGIAGGVAVVTVAGWLATRELLTVAPLVLLRE